MTIAKVFRVGYRIACVASAGLLLAGCAVKGSTSYPELPASAIQIGVPGPGEDYAMAQILAGDYAAAEARLRDLSRYDAHDPFRLINLALVLQRTGRSDEAAALYNRILALQGDATAMLASGNGRSVKDIARTALASLETR